MAERETKFSVSSDYTPAAVNTTYTETIVTNTDPLGYAVLRNGVVKPGANAWIDVGFYNDTTFVRAFRVEQGEVPNFDLGDGVVGPQGYDVAYQIRSSGTTDLGQVTVIGAIRRRTT